ncbi:hypothetical protein ACP6PM_17005, partial [Dapis sp. BLCC M229]
LVLAVIIIPYPIILSGYKKLPIDLRDETSPSFKRRLVSALQSAGEASINEFLDNPYVNVTLETIKGWNQAK